MKSIIAKSVLKNNTQITKNQKFLSLFLAVIVSLGISFSYFGFQIISGVTPMLIIKLVLLFAISCILIYFLYTHKSKEIRFEIIERIMKFKPSNFILLVLCMFVWYSTIITLFGQVCISPDGVAQLLWFNNYTCFDPSSRQDLPNYWLSDHHPFIDTLIYGTFWKFGEVAFGDGITGMRLFIYIQALVWTIVLVYACFWIQKRSHNHATTTSFAVYVFMLINPLIPLWITCALKDISAMPFIMMWLMLLIDVVFPTKKAKSSAIPIILLIATSCLSVLMRKSTLVSCIFIVCGLACITVYRLIRKRKQLAKGSAVGLTTTIVSMIISLILVPAIAYPSLNIAPSGPQESLSLPIHTNHRNNTKAQERNID